MLNNSPALPKGSGPAEPSATVRLIHGDCLEVVPTLEPHSFDLIFADLPYGVTKQKWDQAICLARLWATLRAVTRDTSPMVFTATQPFASDLIVSNRREFRYDLVWDKTRTTGFLNANRMPLRRHEHVLVFYRRPTHYFPQMTQGKPYKHTGRRPDSNYGKVADNTYVTVNDGGRYPTSILNVPSGNRGSKHTTQKPVALMEWILKTYTRPGAIVLDPTAGSGTTAIAALRTGRNVVCIEKDPAYFEVMRKRIADEQARLGFEVTV